MPPGYTCLRRRQDRSGVCARNHFGSPATEGSRRSCCALPLEKISAEYSRESSASGVMMIPIPSSGIYSGTAGLEEARSVPGVTDVVVTAKEGQRMLRLPEGASYLGFIFARGNSPDEVESALRRSHSQLALSDYDGAPGHAARRLIRLSLSEERNPAGARRLRQRRNRPSASSGTPELRCVPRFSRYSFMIIFMCSSHIFQASLETFS